ncbi:hypothetical protein LEMLEM_LOCUS375 [Lemmus lemmus]
MSISNPSPWEPSHVSPVTHSSFIWAKALSSLARKSAVLQATHTACQGNKHRAAATFPGPRHAVPTPLSPYRQQCASAPSQILLAAGPWKPVVWSFMGNLCLPASWKGCPADLPNLNLPCWVGEMAQRLKAEEPGSIPSTHMAAHNCLKIQFQGI